MKAEMGVVPSHALPGYRRQAGTELRGKAGKSTTFTSGKLKATVIVASKEKRRQYI